MPKIEERPPNEIGRKALSDWQKAIQQNIYQFDADFRHSVAYYLKKRFPSLETELNAFAARIVQELEPLVIENNLSQNLPRIDPYDGIGRCIEKVVHHPSYDSAGDIIYGSRLLEQMSKPGGLLEALVFLCFCPPKVARRGTTALWLALLGSFGSCKKSPISPRKMVTSKN